MTWLADVAMVAITWVLGAVFTMMVMECEAEAHDIVWWPLTVLKALFRTLWRALTTDWRP